MVDRERARSLLTVLLVVVGVSAVIGGILSAALFLGASGFGGAGPSAAPPPAGPDPLATRTDTPTTPTQPRRVDEPTEVMPTEPEPTNSPTPEATEEAPSSGFSLEASPTSVGSMEDITLRGTFDGPDGTVLQVQRRLDGGDWEDFPVEATVNNGQFTTTVRSGRTGTNEFRIRDDTGAVTNVVTITVGG
jgi:hypothetical protein